MDILNALLTLLSDPNTLARALAFSTPLLWAALGEIFAERSGVVNLGVEGMMILGAVMGFIVGQSTGDPYIGLAVAGLVGGVAGCLHAFISVTLRANQFISGLALTIFGLGLSGLIGRSWVGIPLQNPMQTVTFPVLSDLPFIGKALFTEQHVLTYCGLVVAALLWVLLYKTRLGLTLRTVGESPKAADSAGINVLMVRYGAVIFGGVMAGIAGGFLSLAYRPSWGDGMTAGMGWIALAITIFAAWDPLRAIFASIFFGAFFYLSFSHLQTFISPPLLKTMPYAFTIIALALSSMRQAGAFAAPEAIGEAYERGRR